MPVIRSKINAKSEAFGTNTQRMRELLSEVPSPNPNATSSKSVGSCCRASGLPACWTEARRFSNSAVWPV